MTFLGQDLVQGRKIGDGSFGVVRRGEWTTSNNHVKEVSYFALFHVKEKNLGKTVFFQTIFKLSKSGSKDLF